VADGFSLLLSIHLQDNIETSVEVANQMSHGTFQSLINPGLKMLSSIDFSMLDISTLAYLRHPNLGSLAMIQYFSTTQNLMIHSKTSRILSL